MPAENERTLRQGDSAVFVEIQVIYTYKEGMAYSKRTVIRYFCHHPPLILFCWLLFSAGTEPKNSVHAKQMLVNRATAPGSFIRPLR